MNLGKRGEDTARRYLEGLGYQYLESNYRVRVGEIDLIMKKDNKTVFVEVKTRREGNKSTSNLLLPANKRQRLQAAIDSYLSLHNTDDWILVLAAVTVFDEKRAKIRIINI